MKLEDTHPLLAVAVLHIIYVLVVPQEPEVQQVGGPEPILRHNDKIREEACSGLHHA